MCCSPASRSLPPMTSSQGGPVQSRDATSELHCQNVRLPCAPALLLLLCCSVAAALSSSRQRCARRSTNARDPEVSTTSIRASISVPACAVWLIKDQGFFFRVQPSSAERVSHAVVDGVVPSCSLSRGFARAVGVSAVAVQWHVARLPFAHSALRSQSTDAACGNSGKNESHENGLLDMVVLQPRAPFVTCAIAPQQARARSSN